MLDHCLFQGQVIENISRRCGGFLRQLSLRGCQSIADGSMKTLAYSCPNVEDLNLNGCKKLTDVTCQALSTHCSKLQRLNLDGCSTITDQSLKALSDGCRQLTHINISWCSAITQNGVEALARGCPKLRTFISKGCKQITSPAVICLAEYCKDLEVVNLFGCNVSGYFLLICNISEQSSCMLLLSFIFVCLELMCLICIRLAQYINKKIIFLRCNKYKIVYLNIKNIEL